MKVRVYRSFKTARFAANKANFYYPQHAEWRVVAHPHDHFRLAVAFPNKQTGKPVYLGTGKWTRSDEAHTQSHRTL
jgi:hypothetical protein